VLRNLLCIFFGELCLAFLFGKTRVIRRWRKKWRTDKVYRKRCNTDDDGSAPLPFQNNPRQRLRGNLISSAWLRAKCRSTGAGAGVRADIITFIKKLRVFFV
jgi:hypothetical protein